MRQCEIEATISVGNYEMIRVRQTAPAFEEARDLLIAELKTLGVGNRSTREKVEAYIERIFGRYANEKVESI